VKELLDVSGARVFITVFTVCRDLSQMELVYILLFKLKFHFNIMLSYLCLGF
jgi:hypothetical protein